VVGGVVEVVVEGEVVGGEVAVDAGPPLESPDDPQEAAINADEITIAVVRARTVWCDRLNMSPPWANVLLMGYSYI
jgi:hypothetical protein